LRLAFGDVQKIARHNTLQARILIVSPPGTAGLLRKNEVAVMRRELKIGLLLLLIPISVYGQELLTRKQGESNEAFINRLLPPSTELAHKVLTGTFGPSENNLLVLFHGANDVNTNYTGWVLSPQSGSPETYSKFVLPEMSEIPAHFEISVSAVLFANADKDKDLELIVLYEYYRNGSGEKSNNAAYVYDWNGREFVVLDDTSMKLVGLKTAAAVRRKLKSLGY